MTRNNQKLDSISAAFGFSVVITLLFNTILTWIKEVYKPLNDLMTIIGGHHWITHGLFDVVLFVLLGTMFYRIGFSERFNGTNIMKMILVSSILSMLGLIGWFIFI
ncbi:MAG TPA: hypothetical protein VLL31_01240 [Sulfurovum sp.]|nr:hypothetical protein [Sulfurovum sp.]